MTAIVCDICKKAIAGARRGDTYLTILDKDVCIPCSDDLLDATKAQMAAQEAVPVQGLPGDPREESRADDALGQATAFVAAGTMRRPPAVLSSSTGPGLPLQ